MSERWFAAGAWLLAAGIAIGAFGAHALKDVLDLEHRYIYDKAVLYHLVNAVGLMALAGFMKSESLSARASRTIGLMLFFGVVIFSGSLYLLCLSGVRWLGAITPIGGSLLIIGWVVVGCKLFQAGKKVS